MLYTRNKILIPTQTVLQESASRIGYWNTASLSPYEGLAAKVNTWIADSNTGFDGNVVELLKSVPDFDFDRIKPYEGEVNEDSAIDMELRKNVPEFRYEDEESPLYVRRFEDMDGSFLYKYMYQIWYRINNYEKGGIREYLKANRVTGVYIDEEDGAVEEKDLITDYDFEDCDQSDVNRALSELPYLLKKIHEASKRLRLSLISLMRAFEIARDKEQNRRGGSVSISDIKPRHILSSELIRDYPVFYMTEEGTLGEMCAYDANKNKKEFADVFKLYARHTDPLCKLMDQFMLDLKIVGCDIRYENPANFVEEKINDVVVTHVINNESYFLRKNPSSSLLGGFVLPEVRNSLTDMPLEYYEEKSNVSVLTVEETINNSRNIFLDAINLEDNVKYLFENVTSQDQDALLDNVRQFLKMYVIVMDVSKEIANFDAYGHEDTFLIEDDGVPAVFNVSPLLCNIPENDTLLYRDALITINGYLVLHVASGNLTWYCKINEAVHALTCVYENKPVVLKWEVIRR